GDRLAGCGRMAEAEAAHGARVVLLVELALLVLQVAVLRLFVVLGLLDCMAVPVPVLGLLLVTRDQLGEHPGERVDLVSAELSAGSKAGRMVGQFTLETEHERVADLPGGRGRGAARPHLPAG